MPWTKKQTRYLMSDSSPLTEKQKAKMKRELHQNPKLGHAKKKNPDERLETTQRKGKGSRSKRGSSSEASWQNEY